MQEIEPWSNHEATRLLGAGTPRDAAMLEGLAGRFRGDPAAMRICRGLLRSGWRANDILDRCRTAPKLDPLADRLVVVELCLEALRRRDADAARMFSVLCVLSPHALIHDEVLLRIWSRVLGSSTGQALDPTTRATSLRAHLRTLVEFGLLEGAGDGYVLPEIADAWLALSIRDRDGYSSESLAEIAVPPFAEFHAALRQAIAPEAPTWLELESSPLFGRYARWITAGSARPTNGGLEITDLPAPGYERIVRAVDRASGLHAIIAIHDTTLGPALGGLRMWPYASEDEALFDVKRLSRGMTFKSAVAHTGLGGGKAVILGDPRTVKSEALYVAMGRFIESLGGKYIAAEDVNTSVGDLEIMRRVTKYVTGLERKDGGSGNPSPYTAYGVFLGIKAALGWVFGSDSCKGRTVAIQGIGAVGSALARRLVEAGAKVHGADKNTERLQQLATEIGLVPIGERDILTMECDVFAPCALGAILNDESIPKLNTPIIAGAANNLLLEPRHGKMLADRSILYAPDYVINAGGVINVSVELHPGGFDEKVSLAKIERIPQALRELWTLAREERIPPSDAADRLAERILADARRGNAQSQSLA